MAVLLALAACVQPPERERAEVAPVVAEVTAYCPCRVCCGPKKRGWRGITASGARAAEGRTIAADLEVWPRWTCLDVEGVGRRIVEDRGRAIKGLRLDVYFARHEDARVFGRKRLKVRLCEGGR